MLFLNDSREDESQEELYSNNNDASEHNDKRQGETDWSWKSLKREFRLSHSESLFHLYQAKLQHSFFVASLILNIIFNVGAIISYTMGKYNDMNLYLILMRTASVVVFISFLILIWFNKLWMQSKFSRTVASLAVLTAMIFGEASGAICALVNNQATPLASIRRTYYLIITNHVFLPFPSRIQSCAATIVICAAEIVVTYISRRDNNCRADYLTLYSSADIIFYASSAMIGFQITFLLEIAIRRTFLNHKYCIQSTYKLNYEKEQQEQLLRSCFPQHLIEQIRAEIRESIARISNRQSIPFKPFYNLYVEKYENVTILYADIVNSMNITDKLNPAELVETLNELYGRFDESAEKYNCLRIKLLGDCYYCVSGLPEYDEQHAMNCLLMGLEMIKIIQSIRESRNVDIDMRIGIHSGSVLSGLLGLRKWQFDIWSLDAMKANQMEHTGQPGFVHITQETLDLLPMDHVRRENLIITATRQSKSASATSAVAAAAAATAAANGGGGGGATGDLDDSAGNTTTYLISERYCAHSSDTASPYSRRRGQTEKLRAYIEKLRARSSANAMDFTQRRMALETSLKKYREIHEKVDETMKAAIDEMPLGSAWKQFFFIDCFGIGSGGGGSSSNQVIVDTDRAYEQQQQQCKSSNVGGRAKQPHKMSSRLAHDNKQVPPLASGTSSSSSNRKLSASQFVELDPISCSSFEDSGCSASSNNQNHNNNSNNNKSGLLGVGVGGGRQRNRNKSVVILCANELDSSSSQAYACGVGIDFSHNNGHLNYSYNDDDAMATSEYRNQHDDDVEIAMDSSSSSSLASSRLSFDAATHDVNAAAGSNNNYNNQTTSASKSFKSQQQSNVHDERRRRDGGGAVRQRRSTSASSTQLPAAAAAAGRRTISATSGNRSRSSRAGGGSHRSRGSTAASAAAAAAATVKSPSNKALLETDPLFHLYLICVGSITLTILAIKCLIPGMPIYTHTRIGFAFLLAMIMVSTIYTLYSRKLKIQFRILIWLIISASLPLLQLVDLIVPDVLDSTTDLSHADSLSCAFAWHPSCAVMFASIPNYESFYTENNLNEQGLKCLQLLNEIICDFDQLLSFPAFRAIEKIKTIGSTYMAACFDLARRTSECTIDGYSNPLMFENNSESPGTSPKMAHDSVDLVVTMVCFATALMENLARINQGVRTIKLKTPLDAFQEFRLRIGIAVGPVIAGVVGASKPTYDIWGDTVNVASRLESSGISGRIQVSEQVAQILQEHGQFELQCRGPIEVKGKGLLTTYLVVTPFDNIEEQEEAPKGSS